MIRNFKLQDLDQIMELWLNTNVSSHSFISKEYWETNFDLIKDMMLDASIYVYEKDNKIVGFVGLSDDYIEGIFVYQQVQSRGIGKQLLDYIKGKKSTLFLNVYKKNKRAVNFIFEKALFPRKNKLIKPQEKLNSV